jgi:redox-sensitive bicupin YhaK (pirin superfamily)
MVIFDDGDEIRVTAAADNHLRFMFMAGGPFREPIVPYGPFVMNTPQEIQQALEDLRNGTFVQ